MGQINFVKSQLKTVRESKMQAVCVRSAIIVVAVIMITAIPAMIYLNWHFYFQNTLTMAGVPNYMDSEKSSLLQDPIQIDLEGYSESGEYKNKPIEITYKAYYDITGIITSVRDYWGLDAYDTLAPRDLCMIWGTLALQYPSPEMKFWHDNRVCNSEIGNVYIDPSDKGSRKGAFGVTHYGVSLISNNHLIPSTAEIRDRMFALGVGDTARIVGYLVRVRYDGILLDSSMTRDDIIYDHSSTTCEIIYVTNVEKL